MKNVNKAFRKKDAMQLVTGKPVYMDDLAPADCLIVKLYRSPHANAMVERIDTSVAKKVPGIEAIFTWEDVPQDAPRYSRIDRFDDGIGMGGAQQLYDQAVLRDHIVHIDGLAGDQLHGILFTERLVDGTHSAASFCFFHARKFMMPRSWPS